jgi:hypothetical protein
MRAYEGKRIGIVADDVEVNVRNDDAAPWRRLSTRPDLAVGNATGVDWGGFTRESEQLAVALLADHFAHDPTSAIQAMYSAVDAGLFDSDSDDPVDVEPEPPTFDELAVQVAPAFLLEVVSKLARGGWFLYDWQIVDFIKELQPDSMKRDTWPATERESTSCPPPSN